MKLIKQKGYTAIELTFLVVAGAALTLVVAGVVTLIHFIAKFW